MVVLFKSQNKPQSGDNLAMNSNNVINHLTRDGFYFIGVIDDFDLDYFELVDGDWYLGVICSENMIVAFNNSIGWGYDCKGEADIELRWNSAKKLIRHSLKTSPIAA